MGMYHIKVKDKGNGKERTLHVGSFDSPEAAIDHVEKMPSSHGGKHPGFEVMSAEEAKPEQEAPIAAEPEPAKAFAPVKVAEPTA